MSLRVVFRIFFAMFCVVLFLAIVTTARHLSGHTPTNPRTPVSWNGLTAVAAIDQQLGDARCAHVAQGDLLLTDHQWLRFQI